jgi:hypothetical protein
MGSGVSSRREDETARWDVGKSGSREVRKWNRAYQPRRATWYTLAVAALIRAENLKGWAPHGE